MGFATNAFGIPAIGGRGTLLISDSLNHSSIVTGARASGATVQVYKHNDYRGLESLVRRAMRRDASTGGVCVVLVPLLLPPAR